MQINLDSSEIQKREDKWRWYIQPYNNRYNKIKSKKIIKTIIRNTVDSTACLMEFGYKMYVYKMFLKILYVVNL